MESGIKKNIENVGGNMPKAKTKPKTIVIEELELCKDDSFARELAEGYFYVEIKEKEKQIKEFTQALESVEDKESFNADYLNNYVDYLKDELTATKKNFRKWMSS